MTKRRHTQTITFRCDPATAAALQQLIDREPDTTASRVLRRLIHTAAQPHRAAPATARATPQTKR